MSVLHKCYCATWPTHLLYNGLRSPFPVRVSASICREALTACRHYIFIQSRPPRLIVAHGIEGCLGWPNSSYAFTFQDKLANFSWWVVNPNSVLTFKRHARSTVINVFAMNMAQDCIRILRKKKKKKAYERPASLQWISPCEWNLSGKPEAKLCRHIWMSGTFWNVSSRSFLYLMQSIQKITHNNPMKFISHPYYQRFFIEHMLCLISLAAFHEEPRTPLCC